MVGCLLYQLCTLHQLPLLLYTINLYQVNLSGLLIHPQIMTLNSTIISTSSPSLNTNNRHPQAIPTRRTSNHPKVLPDQYESNTRVTTGFAPAPNILPAPVMLWIGTDHRWCRIGIYISCRIEGWGKEFQCHHLSQLHPLGIQVGFCPVLSFPETSLVELSSIHPY